MVRLIWRLNRKLFLIVIALMLGVQTGFIAPVQSTEAGTGTLVNVPATSANLQVGGGCTGVEYTNATKVSITVTPAPATFRTFDVFLTHNATDFYLCFTNMPMPQTGNSGFVAVYVDPDNDGGGNDADDFVVLVHPFGQSEAHYWNPASGQYDGNDPGGWSASSILCNELCEWGAAEFRISRQLVGSWRHTAGLALFYHWYSAPGDDYSWPANGIWANPELYGRANFTVPTIDILQSNSTPTVDGTCGLGPGAEYSDATVLSIPGGANGGFIDLYYKHTLLNLYACIDNLPIPQAGLQDGPNAALYINRTGTGGESPGTDAMFFSISYTGVVDAHRGSGSGFTGPDPGGYSAARQALTGKWNAEFRVSSATLGGGWDRYIDMSFVAGWIDQANDQRGWPEGFGTLLPVTWAITHLATTQATEGVDISPERIEINQSIQDTSNSIFLVRNKRTFVRVHVKTNQNRSGVTARLTGTINGQSSGVVLVPANPGAMINLTTTPDTGMQNDSFLFELPASWLTGSGPLVLHVDVNPFHAVTENNYNNNGLTSPAFTFQPTQVLNLVDVSYRNFRLNGTLVSPPTRDQDMLESEVRRMYPISVLSVTRRTLTHIGFYVNTCPNFPWICVDDLPNAVTVNAELVASRPFFGLGRTLYAMVHDRADLGSGLGSGFMRGMGLPVVNVASGPTGPSSWGWDFDGAYGDWYGAHEIAHALWRHHTAACGEPIPYQNYPNSDGTLGSSFVAVDAGDGSVAAPFRIMPGTTWTDIMTYCDKEWASATTYLGLHRNIDTGLPRDPEAPTGDFLEVHGLINLAHDAAAFASIAREPEAAYIWPIVAGPYHLRLLDAGNGVLKDVPFTPNVASENPDAGAVDLVVDFVAGTRRIALYSDAAGKEIASAEVSANPPVISISSRSGGPALPASGPVTLAWTSSDSDGDPLTYNLQYSFDGGATWRLLVTGIKEKSYTIDSAELEGTQGQSTGIFRVTANDGVLTASATSDTFSVGGKVPRARIASPVDGSQTIYGQLVAFEGYGEDFEEGTLTDEKLTWTSDRDGFLGNGRLVHSALLSAGTHQITLQVADAEGQTGSASITIVVSGDETQPGPTLDAGPGPLSFTHGFAKPAPPAQKISIRNTGSGELHWTASTDAGWLSLDSTSGVAPAELMVSVDPTGLDPRIPHFANITVSGDGGGSPQTIPVVLRITGVQSLYLPFVRR